MKKSLATELSAVDAVELNNLIIQNIDLPASLTAGFGNGEVAAACCVVCGCCTNCRGV